MKNKNKANAQRAKRKHAKNVARKGKGAEYGRTVKSFNQIRKLQAQEGRVITGIGTGISEVNSGLESETQSFVEEPKKEKSEFEKGIEQSENIDKGTVIIS